MQAKKYIDKYRKNIGHRAPKRSMILTLIRIFFFIHSPIFHWFQQLLVSSICLQIDKKKKKNLIRMQLVEQDYRHLHNIVVRPSVPKHSKRLFWWSEYLLPPCSAKSSVEFHFIRVSHIMQAGYCVRVTTLIKMHIQSVTANTYSIFARLIIHTSLEANISAA
jgi:hypothetical protein